MFRIVCIFLILFSNLFSSIEIDENTQHLNILSKAQIYIDNTKSLNLEDIQKEKFKDNTKSTLAYGFSPSFSVWVKFTLKNTSNTSIEKILQYNNEVTSDIEFFNKDKKEIKGFFHIKNKEFALSPTFKITLAPFESRTYYIKSSSVNNFLIIKLELWDTENFYNKHSSYQFILAMFFGAFGLLIIYNLFLFFSIRDKSYLWYVLYHFFLLVNFFFYKGLFYKFHGEFLNEFSKTYDIVFPISLVFLSLFIQSFLNIKQYPKIDKILSFYITSISLLIVINFFSDFNFLTFSIYYGYTLVVFLFFIICYSVYQRNRQAYFIISGWLMMVISMIFVFFSTEGIYDFLSYFPYTLEAGVFFEAVLFSFALADRIKVLKKKLLEQQQNEKQRLKSQVEAKTKDLNLALNEKDILLQELLHRIKNNMQFIISLYALKLEGAKEDEISEKIKDVERKVLAMSQVHQMLYNQKNIYNIEATQYFKKIVQTIKNSFDLQGILFNYKIKAKLEMEEAIYCGLIVNELVTNAVKYAFLNKKGEINIELIEDENNKYLSVSDNGVGIREDTKTGFGKVMINALAVNQLKGSIKIENTKGTKIIIQFPRKDNTRYNAS
ncbi:7TM diverse intracellular signaling domain-containing protein [Halarcobacter sp.]|uniref:7TM diverse intracellular signaling domain-containing protein n=1 Tax=Halarcobacter sp. TaxID=2321133 RepID=UPI002AABDECA|nr:7TM diverse intracellular signaling domain-containing protein [Halarcobacter sp.]